MKFALIGCGRIAQKHAEILSSSQVEGCSLAAVCDLIPERARVLGEKHQVPWFKDLHKMMLSLGDQIDIVSILTPSGNHAECCFQLLKYRKHILVEKPISLNLSDSEKMIHACENAGVRLFIVKQNRFNIPVQKLHKAITNKRFGKIFLGTARMRWARKQSYYDLDEWRGTWAYDGGVFTNQASHYIDLLYWMLGDVQSVFAKSVTALANIEVEDTGIALLKFRCGALGVIEATTATRPNDLEGSISILGEKGTVEIDGFSLNKVKTWQFEDDHSLESEHLNLWHENPPNVYGFSHARFLNEVAKAIRADQPGPLEGKAGQKSLEIITAIYQSIEEGREVFIEQGVTSLKLGNRRPQCKYLSLI